MKPIIWRLYNPNSRVNLSGTDSIYKIDSYLCNRITKGICMADTVNFIRLHVNSRFVNLLNRWGDILKAGALRSQCGDGFN